jgi:hypothetical protein
VFIGLGKSHEADYIRLEPELNAAVCRTFPLDKNGRFPNRVTVAKRLRRVRPDLNEIAMEKALDV